MPYGRDDEEWNRLVDEALRFLVERARLRKITTYTEMNATLARRTGARPFDFGHDGERAAMGAHLAITGRDHERAEEAAREIRAATGAHVDVFIADLSSQTEVRRLAGEVMEAYRGPFPTPQSRRPMHVFPHEILGSRPFLAEIERGLPALRDRPALIVWPTKDVAFRDRERARWEELFPNHRTVTLEGAGHYIQEDAPEEIVAAIRDWAPSPP